MNLEQELAQDLAEQAAQRKDHAAAENTRLNVAHRVLRGRYPYAIALGLLGLIVGGVVGYTVPVPNYRSTSQIRVAPVVPKVLYSDEDKRMLPRFEAFIETQVTLIQQQEILKTAAQSDPWREAGGDSDPGTIARMARSLEVVHPRLSETINLHFYDPNPLRAKAGVNAITHAYLEQSRKQDVNDEVKRLQVLEERRTSLSEQLADVRAKLVDQAQMMGTDSLSQLHQSKLSRVEKLQEELDEVQMAIYTTQEAVSGGQTSETSTIEALAAVDSQLRMQLQERELVSREISRLKASLGEEHRAVREQKRVLAGLDDAIHLYAEGIAGNTGSNGISVELIRLRTRERGLKAKVTAAREEVESLGKQELSIAKLREDEAQFQSKLEEVDARIDQLNLESAFSGRISILSEGEAPAKPAIDHRKKVAVALATMGMTLGFGLVLGIGLMDTRIRSLDDARASVTATTVLGMLPTLPEDLTDVEAVNNAAHCVHNIRTMMQIGSSREDRHAFVITSPGPQTGKTSLSMALGLSFAGTGTRTLLIDCDLVGGGLSARADAILADEAIAAEAAGRGLIDVLTDVPLKDCVHATRIPNLTILPLGEATESDVNRLSPKAIKRLLETARETYDTILIDTGPTPGSIESSLVAAQADGVVIVISRGENRGGAERAIEHLRSCGANVVGMVFNRADTRDMEDSGATSVSRRSIRRQDRMAENNDLLATGMLDADNAAKMGPIGRSVALSSVNEEA